MSYIADAYPSPNPVVEPVKPKFVEKIRFASIDALKGIAILCIWLLNNAPPAPTSSDAMRPGPWGHVTFADLVYPVLIFGIGCGLALSAVFSKKELTYGRFVLKCVSAAFWIYIFGVILDCAANKRPTLTVGALQLLAVAYLLNGLLARLHIIARAVLAEVLLLGYYGWIRTFYVPNQRPGIFTEHVNIIQYTNQTVLAPHGLSGALAIISITSILMMGTVAGSFFHMEDNRFKRGLILIICGGTLAFFGWLWSLDQPMVASYWTSSYALFATGIAGVALGILSVLFDMEDGHKFAYIFIIPATCVLTALAGPPLLKMMILDYWRMPNSEVKLGKGLQDLASGGPMQPTWAYTFLFIFVWWIVMAIAYHRRKWIRAKYGID